MPGIPAGIVMEKFCLGAGGFGAGGAPWHFLNFLPLPQRTGVVASELVHGPGDHLRRGV